jgi:hypothetical protein
VISRVRGRLGPLCIRLRYLRALRYGTAMEAAKHSCGALVTAWGRHASGYQRCIRPMAAVRLGFPAKSCIAHARRRLRSGQTPPPRPLFPVPSQWASRPVRPCIFQPCPKHNARPKMRLLCGAGLARRNGRWLRARCTCKLSAHESGVHYLPRGNACPPARGHWVQLIRYSDAGTEWVMRRAWG